MEKVKRFFVVVSNELEMSKKFQLFMRGHLEIHKSQNDVYIMKKKNFLMFLHIIMEMGAEDEFDLLMPKRIFTN